MSASITNKERELLRAIVESEYQDGGNPVDHAVWLDYIVDSKSRGGVLTSLQKKALVDVTIIPLAQSTNRPHGISDSTVAITLAGLEAFGGMPYRGYLIIPSGDNFRVRHPVSGYLAEIAVNFETAQNWVDAECASNAGKK